jgi:hypothetical protein
MGSSSPRDRSCHCPQAQLAKKGARPRPYPLNHPPCSAVAARFGIDFAPQIPSRGARRWPETVIQNVDEVMNGARTATLPARHSHWIAQQGERAEEELSYWVCALW